MQADLSDERLMLAYRAGDADAFTTLYRRYRGSLYRYLAQQCGDPAVAEDLYQETWIKVVHARADYQPLARFSTWIFRIARHRLIDHYRKHAPQVLAQLATNADDPDALDDLIASLPAPGHETPHALHERQHTAQRINLALAALPPAQREVFLLAEEGGLTLEEIAAATDSGRETAKSRLRYALTKLRHSLQDLL
ncbi:RNA polymerase sigma factor [Candidatus Accumulibacter contiguus]|jgi:RNA polymerase sigma factor (sigma-70 family)|uniref:RNA polymerase sigma factor n=1 Tax=Candidatus Accumulibacter contiguus TaxID=2954381 RepID=A0ABX1T8X7_9PROT|nr:RNA polymerase sigma factor [Candidatus Accumulibacter contiguus]